MTTRLIDLLQSVVEYTKHEIGCPEWFRIEANVDESHLTHGKPCDCGLQEATDAIIDEITAPAGDDAIERVARFMHDRIERDAYRHRPWEYMDPSAHRERRFAASAAIEIGADARKIGGG